MLCRKCNAQETRSSPLGHTRPQHPTHRHLHVRRYGQRSQLPACDGARQGAAAARQQREGQPRRQLAGRQAAHVLRHVAPRRRHVALEGGHVEGEGVGRQAYDKSRAGAASLHVIP